jgi:hypothetical protein
VTKKDITDTTKLSPELKFAIAAADAVPVQDKLGQIELANSTQLPIDGLLGGRDRPRWEALGVKILDDVPRDDKLFCHVELPPGWKKVPTDHSLWTHLVDADGKLIAEIGYKAAFYDRWASVQLNAEPPPPASAEPSCVCADCGHEQSTMDPCEKCRSVRVVLVSVVVNLFGENWRDNFKDEPKETP